MQCSVPPIAKLGQFDISIEQAVLVEFHLCVDLCIVCLQCVFSQQRLPSTNIQSEAACSVSCRVSTTLVHTTTLQQSSRLDTASHILAQHTVHLPHITPTTVHLPHSKSMAPCTYPTLHPPPSPPTAPCTYSTVHQQHRALTVLVSSASISRSAQYEPELPPFWVFQRAPLRTCGPAW